MSEEEKLHNELEENYEKIVEMLSNGNFLQLNGKAINLTELNEYINAQQEEIERLNNIINELEKYCIEEIEDYSKEIKSQYITDIAREQYEGEKVCFEDILDRLQELKGSDKE